MAIFGSPGPAHAQFPVLDESDKRWLGEQIFQAECAGRRDCLTAWNAGEEFPSLGIGHFIWIPRGQESRYEQTFPALVEHILATGRQAPTWLQQQRRAGAPWQSREQFLAQFDDPRMQELRNWLYDTRHLQVEFILARFEQRIGDMRAQGILDETASKRLHHIALSEPPSGLYALVDYSHFKGMGTAVSERYRGEGWGLLQVLESMDDSGPALTAFVEAAAATLQRRVRNAPVERNEQRWIKGWLNRVEGYLP